LKRKGRPTAEGPMAIGPEALGRDLTMAETNLAFSKVVATPTPTAWSQAYSAGRLFAVISLQADTIPQEGEEHLTSIGKDLISTLESEFFTLENKNLDSIKQALTTTITRVREDIKISLVVCFLSENVLYLFAAGGGKAVLKRGEKIGTVLQADDESVIKSASGYVAEGDIIILQTKSFLRVIPSSTLASSLDHNSPDQIAENLAPHVHDKAEGGASAVILLYKEGQVQDISGTLPNVLTESESGTNETLEDKREVTTEDGPVPAILQSESEDINEPVESQETTKPPTITPIDETDNDLLNQTPSPFLTDQFPRRSRFSFGFGLPFLRKIFPGFPRQRRIILIIAAVLIALIGVTSFLALSSRQTSQNQKLFTSVFAKAQEKYDEGRNLKDLNAPLAQDSFKGAKKILDDNKNKFKDNSNEKKQILVLLDKVNGEISNVSTGESVSAKEVRESDSKILSYEINNSGTTYFTQNSDNVYFLDGTGVSQIDKGNDKKTQVIKKDWKEDGGIGLFGSNIYVLDRKDGILKFIAASSSSYTKAEYFTGNSPDLGSTVDMTINGSVYILFKDGHIDKYTRAKKDAFEISGLDKPLLGASRIFTNDESNLYILDNGNSRVVVLDKTGKFKKAYSANIIKKAKDFEVSEKDKKIYVLSGGKVYQIDLK